MRIHTRRTRESAFTLLELLASMAILAMMMIMLFSAFNQGSKAWLQGENRVETFQQARAALDMVGRELAQAMANTNLPFMANYDSLAFIAPVSDDTNDVVDLTEVVYRLNYLQGGIGKPDDIQFNSNNIPPFKLLRRVSAFSSSNCWNYGLGATCSVSQVAYDFYTSPNRWPETGDFTRTAVVAENVVKLSFEFVDIKTNLALNSKGAYWNSIPTSGVWDEEILPSGILHAGGNLLWMTNRAPLGVRVYLDVMDSRGVKTLQSLMAGQGNNPTNTWPAVVYAAYLNIMSNSVHQFQTYVAIPNRQP